MEQEEDNNVAATNHVHEDNSEEDLGEDISEEGDVGGLYKKIVREGQGEATTPEGSEVFVHYVGRLTDGTVFDSSRERHELFSFKLGEGQVIRAWDVGVKTMKKGEVAILTCSPTYGYGERGNPPNIPPNSQLAFEVEVFYWKGENVTEDGGVMKIVLKKGENFQTPNNRAEVTVHVVGHYDDHEFEDRTLTFTLGEGEDHGVVEGVELALEKMEKEEKAEVTVKPKYAYGDKGSEELGIPPNATLQYDVEMLDLKKAREGWEMDLSEKLEMSKSVKEKGTEFFKGGKYERALKEYKRFLTLLDSDNDKSDEEVKSMLLKGHLNVSACLLKLGQHYETIGSCEKALELDQDNIKAYFRRGQAQLFLGNFDEAKSDFQEVLKREPRNKAAQDKITVANKRIQQVREKERKLYSNMFEKFAAQDERKAAHNGSHTEKEETKTDTLSEEKSANKDEVNSLSDDQEAERAACDDSHTENEESTMETQSEGKNETVDVTSSLYDEKEQEEDKVSDVQIEDADSKEKKEVDDL